MDLRNYNRMTDFLNMFDILKEYNVAKGDPLGADYDEMAIDLVDGKTVFWLNGNWAWRNLEEPGAKEKEEYEFLRVVRNKKEKELAYQRLAPKQSKLIKL